MMGREHWVETPLGSIVLSRKGKKPNILIPEKKEGYLPYILIDELEGNKPRNFTNESNLPFVNKNDVLLVWDGSIGKCASGIDGIIGSTLVALTPLGLIPTKFLEYIIINANRSIKETSTGTGLQHINKNFLKEFYIYLPPLNEQKRIVEKLDALLPKVKNAKTRLEKIPALLKKFRQSVLASACSGRLTEDWREGKEAIEDAADLIKRLITYRNAEIEKRTIKKTQFDSLKLFVDDLDINIDKWVVTYLNHVSSLITDGKHGDCKDESNSGYYFLSAKDIQGGMLLYDNAREINYQEFKEVHNRTNLEPGDICMVNTGATVGKMAIAQDCVKTFKTTFQKSVAIIKPIKEFINNKYIAIFINFQSEQLLKASKGSAINNLLIGEIKKYQIPLPPLEEQHEIVRRVEKLCSLADSLEAKYQKALGRVEKIEQSLLAKAFRGELVESDPNDEPAEELLKRIWEEKARLDNGRKLKKPRVRRLRRSNS